MTTIFCITYQKKTFAVTDHVGRLTCKLCGGQVEPFIHKELGANA